MDKVKFKFKLSGLEIEYEGSREEMKHVISQQVNGLIQPALAGTASIQTQPQTQAIEDADATLISPKNRRTRRTNASSVNGKKEKAQAIDFVNDIASNGAPTQKWSAVDKGLWILYVVEKLNLRNDLSTTEVSETFNKHFKQAKIIRPSNISRDFGSRKTGNNALVGENTTVSPSRWYLTEEGKKYVQNLIINQSGNGAN